MRPDVRELTVAIVCVARLIAKHDDAKLLFVLPALTNCPKTESANIYDRCKARYEGMTTKIGHIFP